MDTSSIKISNKTMMSSNHLNHDTTTIPFSVNGYEREINGSRRHEMSLDIINLNYEGILLLQQRANNGYQHTAALSKFGQALDLLRVGIDNEMFYQTETSTEANSKKGSIHSVPICTEDEQILTEQASPHNPYALFERVFYIDPTSNCLDLCDVDFSIVIMVNMAITCHQRGLKIGGAQSKSYLHKALGLYKMTASLILAEADGHLDRCCNGIPSETSNRCTRTLHSKTIVLALFNNMMHLYSHLLLSNETIECGKKLVYMLKHNYITTTGVTTASSSTAAKYPQLRYVVFQESGEEDHSIFVLNALLVSRSPLPRLAPAA